MPIPPNTEFENKLASSNFGQTPNLASTQNVAKTAAEMSADELLQLVSSQARQVSKPVPNPFAPLQVSPNAIDFSGRYPKQLVGWDNEDIYGSMQSNWNKAANGTLKALNLATTTFLQGTVGLVYGLGNVIGGNGLNSFYNNDLSQSIEKWNKSTENSLPNYYTNKETNAAWYSPDNLFTANFLFDKLIKNAGFSIGALYSGGVVSKAISTAMKGVGLFSEANQALKVTQALEEALPATAQAGRFSKFQEIVSNSLPKLSPTQVDRTITSFLGAATEGGIEALQGLNEYRDLTLAEFQKTNGRAPNEAEMKEINSQAASVGNARFFFNIGLLSATNYIQLPKILGSRYSTSKALANTEAATLGEAGAIKRTADRTFAKATGNNFLEKAYNRTGNVTKYFWAPMEAFEEGAQFVIEKGTKDYYTKKYGGQGADFISSLQEGVSQLSSKEGMESIVLGGLSGGLQQIRGNIKGMGQERQATGALLSSLNSTQEALKEIKSDKWLNDMKDATSRGINLMQENAQQVADGNILEAKDLEADLMHNYLAARIKNGRYDLVKEDIAYLRQQGSTQEGLEKLITQGYADQSDTIQTFQKRLSNFEAHADNLKPTFEALNLKYGGLYVNSPTGERKRQYPEAVIDQMAYAVSKVADYDQRIPELSQQLIAKGVEVQGIIDAPETVKEALAHIDGLQINVDQKETLKQALSDVLTMSKRRQQFLKAYDDIAANPDGYEETSPTPTSTPETVKIKTKDGDEDIVVGEEYYLGKVTEHDKNGHEVYRFPKLTILGENEDGTIKIRTSSGEIKDVAKSVLEDYKLGKVADLQNNKKAKFYFDHINDTFEFNFGKGKKQIGRLQYSQKDHILLFTYRKNGKTKSIEVTGDQFIPKEGYNQPMIKKVGTLTAAQEQSLKEFSEEKDVRQQAKRASRLAIIESLVDETGKRMGDVASMLQNRYNDFEKVTEELSKLEQKIKAGELTKKNNFKASTNRAIKAANKLSRLQNELKLEIEKLETERDELEFNLEYFHDLASNIDELPTDSKDFIEEINNQALDLELLIEETGKSITQISSLIDKVSDALDSAIDWLRENIRLFKNVYPKAPLSLDNDEFNAFLEANPNFLKLRPEYINDLRQLEDLVSQVEDLDIKPNERTLHELNQHLEETLEKIKELEKQYKAKEAIIKKFAQAAKEYKEQKIAEAIARQNVELQAQFFNKLKQIEGESGIETASPEEQEESETEFIKKKEAAKRNIATISGTINPEEADKRDSNKRHEQFLSQVDLFPNRGQILQTFVTANNEEAFGLKGIISTYLGTHVPEEGGELILALYIEQDTTGQYFVDVNGKRIGKVGEPIDQNLIVFGPMTSDRMSSKKYGDRYSGADQEELLQWQKLWKKKRDEILALKGKSYTVEFKTSRGIPIIDRDAENRPTGKKFPILSNLVSEQQLNDGKRLLVVSTIGTIEHQGRNVKIPVGRVMIQNGSTLEYANNRNLTEKEALATFAVLKDFVKKANNKEGFDPKYVQFLQGMLFFSSPYTKDKETGEYIKQEKPVARNQFYFHKGDFYFGEKEFPIPFTSESMEANKASILAFLTGAYNHVNEKALKNNRTFIEFNEQLEEKHWPTYQHFLLSKEGRTEEEVPLSTIVRPISPLVPNDRNFNNKYSYAPSLFTQEELPTKKPVEQTPQQAPVSTAGMSNFERVAAYLAETANAPEAPKANVGGFNLANFQTKQGEETAGNNAVIPMDAVLAAKAPNTVELAPEMDEATKMELERIAGNKASKEEPQNRLVGAYNYTLADVEKELKELERISPLPIKTIKNLIAAGNGLFSFGQYMNGLILLSEQMEEGTGYHELFHGIFDAFLNKKEKDSIYKEFSQRKGTFVERITGDVIAYKDATIGQANEQMAEEFREFKLDGLLPDNISTNGGIIKFFQDLFKWIASMFTGDVHSLNKLFSRIDAAYYKNVPFKSIPSSSPQSRIKIGSLTSLDTQSVIKGIVGAVFQKLTEVGGKYQNYKLLNDLDFGEKIPKEIYDDIRNDLKDFYQTTWYEKLKEEGMSDEANFNKRAPVINSIFPNWPAFVQASGEFLKTFKILQEQEQDKEGEDSKHDNREDSYLREAFEYDGKKNAPATIKLFLGTIQESEFVNKLEATTPGEAFTPRAIVAKRDEATGMPIMLDYSNVYNDIMYNLMNYNTLEEKEQRIIELSKTRPEYVRIYNRLKIGRENLSMAEWDFKTKFYNTFAKQSPIALNTYIGDDGNTHIGAAELDSPIKQLSNNWLQTLKDSPAVSFDPVKKTYILDTNHSTNSGATFPKHISPFLFLKTWGIDFTKEQIARINSDQLAKLERAIATFKTIVTGKKDISSLQKLGVKAPLDTIFSIYLQSENLVPNSVFTNLEGNNRQSVVGTNAFSREINDINNSPTRKKLLEQLPHLQLPFSKDSWYVNEGWFNAEGNSLKQKLSTSYNQGIVTPNQDRNIPTEKLTEAKRLAHAINQNLRENYYFLLPGDSQTEWAIKLKNRFRSLTQEALDQFYSYYQTEQQLGGSKGRVFNFLAKEDKTGKEITLSKEEFIKQYTAFFNKEVEKQFQQLLENNIIQQEVDEKYTWKGLDGDFAEEFKFSPKFLTIGQINDILTYRTINFQFNNIEIYKVFFGDPKEFGKKDSKRWKTFGSPREQSLYDSSELNEIANKEYNNVNGIELKQGDPGYLFWTDELKTVSTQDVFSLDTLPGYDDKTNPINGTDGGAVATLVSARQIMKKNARLDSRQEALIDYALAEDRLLMEKDGEYIYTSKALRQHDERLTASPLDNGAKISPAKPVVSGFTEDGPILDKYSIAFITYKAVRGTNWAKQYKRMLKENISYMIYESGRKVGAKELDSIYNADGSPNTATFLPNSIINVPFKWFGIQVETGGDTTSQTWGSQTGKIITSNLLNAGVPIDYEGTYDEWNALPEEERSTPIYSLVKQERQLREAMIEQGYKQLLEKVGINKDGTVSKKRLLSLIKDELTRRELNDNIKEALEINEDTKDFLIPLEALNNYEQIKNVIFSYVSKYISSPKVGGGSKIMVSGSGWEVAGHRIVKHFNKTTGKAIFTSAGLHNYTKEEPWTGILIGNWFAEKLRNIPALNGKTDKDIFDYVNNSPDGKKILNGVGFRIPTQELNSIENFKIEGFLPQEFRGMVVVAESITKKSGGDFDVDKLNTYLKNVYINGNGELMLIPYLGEGEEAIQAFRTIVDKETIQKMMNITYLDKHFNTELKPTSAETEQLSVEELERWEEQRMEDAKNDEDLAQIMYKKSLENEYFATVSNIITLEENFSRLISPNHSKNLKDLRDLLVKISEEEFGQGAIKSVLSPTYMNTLRHMYISGKSLVGIPASAQVQNAVAQKTAVVISPSKISQLKDDNEKTYIGDGAINLPHNTVKIGGKLFSTISNAKDQVGRYISEKISQFINGFVDITEDPFLVQLGVNRNNAGVYILLERLGVPTPTTILFMNQPIIREYQKMLERNDKSYPFIDISEDKTYGIEVIRSQFHAGGQTGQEQMFPKKGLDSLLEKNIEDYYNGELTMDQNDFQQFVLSEWLKYSVIASNLFRLSQATNYDTTKFSNPYLYLRKKLQQKYANSNNVFSSADGVMESVFVGKLADRIGDAITKISDSFFKFLHSDITPYVFPTMYQLAERKKMNDQDFLKASRKVEQAFISYLIQNTVGRDGRPINEDITSLLLNEETSAASLLNKLKKEFNNQPNNPFKILDRFIGTDKHSPTAAKTIRIFNKPRSAFEQNVFIGAMEELRDNPKTKELYGKLLRVAFLQSGIAQTPYSFSEIIPVEDFKHFVFPAIKNLYNKKLLEGFQATDTFYKNSWRDPNIVPRNAVTYKSDDFGNRRVKNRLGASENEQEIKASNALYAYAQAKGINNFQAYKISTKATNFSSDYITMQLGTKEKPALYLMKKLYDSSNQPVLRAYSKSFPDNKYAIYYSINPLGDGYKGQEHYTSKRPSVFKDTEAVTMEAELSPQEIIEALEGKQLLEQGASQDKGFDEFKNSLDKECN